MGRSIERALHKAFHQFCSACEFTMEADQSDLLTCSESMPYYMVYQARLYSHQTGDLVYLRFSLQDWVQTSPNITAESYALTVSPNCPVFVSSFEKVECIQDSRSLSDSQNAAAASNGGPSTLVFVAILSLQSVALLLYIIL